MYYTDTPIKFWAEEDRPREKLMKRGIGSLTDSELLAIILGQGTVTQGGRLSALDLARQLLATFGSLERIARCKVNELTRIKGIGKAKAISIVACFELGRRKASEVHKNLRVTDSKSVANYLQPMLADLDQEVFYVLFLNRNNELQAEQQIFKGGISATIIDPRLVFKEAIAHLSSALIIAHNHPSGSLTPSQADISITRQLKEGGELFGIQVLDHLIISRRGYYSFADEGML
jgi:DNA repair protein RadC